MGREGEKEGGGRREVGGGRNGFPFLFLAW
jgi:hypothetical protein